jgi:hypothetical protein
MTQLDYLLKYVRTGTAEGDRAFLGEIFVPPAQFAQLCAIEPGGLRLLVGDKGLGKSALVEWIHKVATSKKLPSLLIRPDDIVNRDVPNSSDIASLKRYYYDLLLRTIAAQVGRRLQGFLKGSAAKLHVEAQQAGLTEDDFVQKSLLLISAVALPGSTEFSWPKSFLGQILSTHLLAQSTSNCFRPATSSSSSSMTPTSLLLRTSRRI